MNRSLTIRRVLRTVAVPTVAVLALGACGSAASTASPTAAASTGAPGGQDGPPGAPPGGGGGGAAQYEAKGVYVLSEGTATKSGEIVSTEQDTSGVLVTGGALTLRDATVATSGATSSSDESSFYGLDAGILVSGGTATVDGGTVTTTGDGANDVFAYGDGAVTVTGTTVEASGRYAHGIMASGGGTITATDVTATTFGGNSAAVATDRGSGTITVTGGAFSTSGADSPAIYSTGVVTTHGGTYTAADAEAVVIEGSNSVTVNGSDLVSHKAGSYGVMLYQSFSGDAEGQDATYTQNGGSLVDTASDSPLFLVTNTSATITLSGVDIDAAGGVLLRADAARWGQDGSNGGHAVLVADDQVVAGDVAVGATSTATVRLTNGSQWTGTVDGEGTGSSVTVALDASSRWTLTGDPQVGVLTGAKISGGTVTNIVGNGHTLSYDASATRNAALGGKTYSLSGGGTLAPA